MIGTGVAVAGAAGLAAVLWGTYYPNSPLFGPVVGSGPANGPDLFLTFDDGPNPGATNAILDTLAAEEVPAAFFQVGSHVRRFPAIARAVAEAGQTIGNHTFHHVKLHRCGPDRIARELEQGHRAITETAGVTPRAFRAPHGYRNPFVTAAARRLGYQVVGWSFGVWDSARPGPEEIRRRVRRRLRPGAIILLHDGDGYDPLGDRSQTAAALPGVIRDARDGGFRFRPITELLQ